MPTAVVADDEPVREMLALRHPCRPRPLLRNVRERLATRHRNEAEPSIAEAPGGGTIARLSIPLPAVGGHAPQSPAKACIAAMLVGLLVATAGPTLAAGPAAAPSAAIPDTLSAKYGADMFEALLSCAAGPEAVPTAHVVGIAERLIDTFYPQGSAKWSLVIYQLAKMPDTMDVEALALPGNRIAIADYAATHYSDDALAFTIGHEMGHVILKHQNQTWAAIIKRTGVKPVNWVAVSEAGRGDADIQALARSQEYAADQFGYALARRAGFDARRGALEVFGGGGEDPLHPTPADRLKALGITPTVRTAFSASPAPTFQMPTGGDDSNARFHMP